MKNISFVRQCKRKMEPHILYKRHCLPASLAPNGTREASPCQEKDAGYFQTCRQACQEELSRQEGNILSKASRVTKIFLLCSHFTEYCAFHNPLSPGVLVSVDL